MDWKKHKSHVWHSALIRWRWTADLVTTLTGSRWMMVMSGSVGWGGLLWYSAGRKNSVWTSFLNVFPSSIMLMRLITGTVIPRYRPACHQYMTINTGPDTNSDKVLCLMLDSVCPWCCFTGVLCVGGVWPAEFSLQMKRISFMKLSEMLCS